VAAATAWTAASYLTRLQIDRTVSCESPNWRAALRPGGRQSRDLLFRLFRVFRIPSPDTGVSMNYLEIARRGLAAYEIDETDEKGTERPMPATVEALSFAAHDGALVWGSCLPGVRGRFRPASRLERRVMPRMSLADAMPGPRTAWSTSTWGAMLSPPWHMISPRGGCVFGSLRPQHDSKD
jgi:hypothetical protein